MSTLNQNLRSKEDYPVKFLLIEKIQKKISSFYLKKKINKIKTLSLSPSNCKTMTEILQKSTI